MKIKRTFGATMREALAQIKQEQGAEAVILGNRKVPGGVEILSSIDFDQQQLDQYAQRNDEPADRAAPLKAVAVNAPAALADSERESVPDFILNQSQLDRREPVLGLATSPARAATATGRDGLVDPRPQRLTPRAGHAPAKQRKIYRRRQTGDTQPASAPPPVDRSAATSRQDSRIDVTAANQADRLLHDLRDDTYRRQPAEADNKPVIEEVKDELKNLRDLMKSQLNVLEWDRYSQRHPVRSVLLNLMTELGLGSDVTEMIFANLEQMNEDPQKVWQQALGILATAIPVATSDILSSGGRVAMVGSTGVGKTTTIAKLAARFAHNHGKQSVALITTDNFRIGAHEQLQHFARMLEIPLLTANTSEELTDRLKMLGDKRLVLIDTAGMSQNDVRLSEQFHELQHGSPEISPYLVLSANTQLAALNETINNFSKVKLSGAVVTKLDESASLGGIITAAIRHQLPLTYCGTGQRVPEDLHQAKNHRLVSKAVSLMQKYSEDFDKETLAFRFNHLISQQQGL